MRRSVLAGLAIAVIVAGALSGAPGVARAAPSRALAKPPAGRTLAVRIAGLSRGQSADVWVTGPRRYRHKLTRQTTLRHLRVGTYQIRVYGTPAAHGARSYPARRTFSARVSAKLGAVVSVRYAILVPRSTRPVSTRAIKGIKKLAHHRQLVTVRAGTGLKAGDVLATGVSSRTPHGLLVRVVSVRSSTSVVVAPTTLLAAVPSGQIDAQDVLTQANETAQARRAGLYFSSTGKAIEKKVDESLGACSGSVDAKASGTVSISPAFHLAVSWGLLHGVTSASLTASITESTDLKASISASGSCKGEHELFKDPVTFATFVVWVGPVPIVLQPQLQITLGGMAKVNAAITTSASQSLTVAAGLQWKRGKGISPIDSVTKKLSHQAPTLTASGNVEVDVNPEVNLLIEGVGGPEVGLTGGFDLSADINKVPWWELNGYLAGNVGLTIPTLKIDKRVELARKTWEIAHAGEPTIAVSPDVAYPFNVQVCGPGNRSASIDVQGSGFRPGDTVDVATDWIDYGSTTVGNHGTFDAEESIGEVPNADHTYYGVYAGPATSSIELNADSCTTPTINSDGTVTLQWGVNGYEPNTEVDLFVNDSYTDSGTIDDGGSGGSTITFACPDDGFYVWDVLGTDNGHSEHNLAGDITASCTPAAARPAARSPRPAAGQVAAGGAVR